jgi:hypothetical protein
MNASNPGTNVGANVMTTNTDPHSGSNFDPETHCGTFFTEMLTP